MAYNTGNPVGSTDPRDLKDNSEALDMALNSSDTTFVDRLGQTRSTLAGLETLATGVPAVAASLAAQEAQAAAEAARDASQTNATLYPDEATGRAAVADNAYFRVVGSGAAACHIYKRINSGSSTLIVSLASDSSVVKPAWSGKSNAWPDTFFRSWSMTNTTQFGRARWRNRGSLDGSTTGWTQVANQTFDGTALRRGANLGASSPSSGPLMWMDEIGASVGDSVTAYFLAVGSGAAVRGYGFWLDASMAVISAFDPAGQAGGISITASATPQWLRFSATVPANAVALMVAPFTLTADATFDVVAFWGFKGSAAAGPSWPTLDDVFFASRYHDSRISAIEEETVPKADFAVDSATAVSASATSIVVDVSGVSANSRDIPFMGWAEKYTLAGVSFNAIKIKSISRSSAATKKWRSLKVVVRTGASPEASGATVVAVGESLVVPTSDALTDVIILLKDPSTGAAKTLSDASFSGGHYLIGVYAICEDGTPAACGEPLGTSSNAAGQSYYHVSTVNAPLTGAWSVYSGNLRIGFQHLLLTSPAEGFSYSPTQQLIDSIGESSAIPAPEIVMPPAIYGVQGRECNVYFDNLHLADATDYNHDISAAESISQQQSERWTWTPAGAMTSGTMSVSVADKRTGTVLSTKSAVQRAAASSAGSGLSKKVMVIGDSLVNAGVITQTLLDIAATDVMGVTLLGTQGTAPNRHEGRGGWTVAYYTGTGPTYYDFTVSGVSTPPAINSTEYSHNGSVYRVQTVSLSGGSGTLRCSVVSGGAPQASGTLTKSNGGIGDATISFSASATAPGNPFWIGGALNFGQYLADNSISAPDWVMIALGINDIFGQTSDAAASAAADSAFTQLDSLIASIKSADANVKIGLMLPSPPSSSQDAFGASYGCGQTQWRDKRNILIWSRQLIAKYAGQEASRIYIVPSNTALDTVNNMNTSAAAPVNSRNTAVQVSRQNNGVHPASSGYQQIADAVWSFLKFYA